VGGGAHSAPFGLLISPKRRVRTGEHARLKNVRNEMKKIRQTNFTH
jgi:hypothetical protein